MLEQEGARGMYAEQNAMLDWSPAQQPKLCMCVASGNKRQRRVIDSARMECVWIRPYSNLVHLQCALCSKRVGKGTKMTNEHVAPAPSLLWSFSWRHKFCTHHLTLHCTAEAVCTARSLCCRGTAALSLIHTVPPWHGPPAAAAPALESSAVLQQQFPPGGCCCPPALRCCSPSHQSVSKVARCWFTLSEHCFAVRHSCGAAPAAGSTPADCGSAAAHIPTGDCG